MNGPLHSALSETRINFLKSKMRTIKINDNRLFELRLTSLVDTSPYKNLSGSALVADYTEYVHIINANNELN